jgi:hypothetical protein
MADFQADPAEWKHVLFEYVNAVNEAFLRGDESRIRAAADPAHGSRLAERMLRAARRDAERNIRVSRSEVRARIERFTQNGREVTADVSLHSVRSCEQKGVEWQEERVERERIRFAFIDGSWKVDGAEPLSPERSAQMLWVPVDEPDGVFERTESLPSIPLINIYPQGPLGKGRNLPRVYAGSAADGLGGVYSDYSYGRRGIPYRRELAVAYAERWWNEPNPAYENFDVNCTNYVSQCLFAGRAPMNYTGRRESGWWYKGRVNGREWWSFSWAVADSLRRYLAMPRSFGLRAVEVDSPEKLRLGDVICYDWDGTGRIGHNTIVTAFTADGEPLVNANTVSSRHRFWDYRDSYAWTEKTRYRFFHIADEF